MQSVELDDCTTHPLMVHVITVSILQHHFNDTRKQVIVSSNDRIVTTCLKRRKVHKTHRKMLKESWSSDNSQALDSLWSPIIVSIAPATRERTRIITVHAQSKRKTLKLKTNKNREKDEMMHGGTLKKFSSHSAWSESSAACPRPRGGHQTGEKLAPGAFATLERRDPQGRAHIWVVFSCKGAEGDKWRGPKCRADALVVVVLWRKDYRAARPVGPTRRAHFRGVWSKTPNSSPRRLAMGCFHGKQYVILSSA